jgi:hypothetical protein
VVLANTYIGPEVTEATLTLESLEKFDRSSNQGAITINSTEYELPNETTLSTGQEYDISFTLPSNSVFYCWEASPSNAAVFGNVYGASTTVTVTADCTIKAVYGLMAPTSFHILVNSTQHNNYGLGYPVTYIFAIPQDSSNLKAYKRHSATSEWTQLTEKTSNDFFNGIECVRFDYTNNKAYVSVAFSSDSDDIYIKITDSAGNLVNNVLLGFTEYYDNRKAVVTVTADDYDGGYGYAFDTAIPLFQARSIWVTVVLVTQGLSPNPQPNWTSVQNHINNGYVEVGSHSRTHPQLPYSDYDSEIGGSKTDIIDNLDLPSIYKKGATEYVWAWAEPYGQSDSTQRRKCGYYKYLIDRSYWTDGVYSWATWDSTNALFNRIGISVEMGTGPMGTTDLDVLNGRFDYAYKNGGIYHLMVHPPNVDWSEGQYAQQHLDYIKEKKDVWYVGFGSLYAYRYVTTVADLSITPMLTQQYWFVNISSIPLSGGVTSPSGVQGVPINSPLFVAATSNSGFNFKEWVFDGEVVSNSIEIELPPQEPGTYHTLNAIFISQVSYGLTLNVVGNGYVSRNPDKSSYYYGEVVTLTATPNPGWSFSGWSGDLSGSVNPAELTIRGDMAVTATFTFNVYTLAVGTVGNGNVILNNTGPYHYRDIVELTAVPALGWSFAGWSGDLTGSANPVIITIDSNKSVTATFTQNTYALTISTVGSGSVNVNNTGPYHYGDFVELTAVPSIGWSFDHWNGDISGSVNPATILIDGNKVVTATFIQNKYALTVTVIGSGSVNLNNTGPYHYGDIVELTAVPAAGWSFSGWSGDLSGSVNPAELTIRGDMAVTATFTQSIYVITASVQGVGGTIMPSGVILVAEGQDITFAVATEPGYHILNLNVDGTYMGPQSSFTFYDVQENHTIIAFLAKDDYTLTIIIVGGGEVTVNPNTISFSYGDIVTITAKPNNNWVFSGWSGDITGTANPATIIMDSCKTIIATFTRI